MDDKIYYGKGNIALYRSYASALKGLNPIPESAYTGQQNTLFAVDLDLEVFGSIFMPSYTEGDNSMVVPTATMTNFAYKKALGFEGATLEGFLHYLAQEYLSQYPQMESVRLSAKELPFIAQPITSDGGATVAASDRLFAPSHDSYAFAQLSVDRTGITDHQCGQLNMKLIKLTGSAFANFVQDEYTTLPQRNDRPLYIYLDMGWRYEDANDAVSDDHSRYISAQQVHDHLIHTFHDFVSMSIQHLVYEMGIRLLRRFPQMGEVWFKAQNRLWDTAADSPDSDAKVYMDPRPPYGMIGLKLTRDDL
jgi:urate oxidase / 2-oxo-4-hydroxy-4-carboxy-5-ureidoimidazoline decarboxylase